VLPAFGYETHGWNVSIRSRDIAKKCSKLQQSLYSSIHLPHFIDTHTIMSSERNWYIAQWCWIDKKCILLTLHCRLSTYDGTGSFSVQLSVIEGATTHSRLRAAVTEWVSVIGWGSHDIFSLSPTSTQAQVVTVSSSLIYRIIELLFVWQSPDIEHSSVAVCVSCCIHLIRSHMNRIRNKNKIYKQHSVDRKLVSVWRHFFDPFSRLSVRFVLPDTVRI